MISEYMTVREPIPVHHLRPLPHIYLPPPLVLAMVLKLYGNSQATCTKRVVTILKEKDVTFELHSVDTFKREQKLPDYLEKQPFGQIPYLVSRSYTIKFRAC